MLTFTKSMLALSVMAAVGGANAATYTVDTTLTDKIFTEGIVAINGATVTVAGDEITGKLFRTTRLTLMVNIHTSKASSFSATLTQRRLRSTTALKTLFRD